MEALTIKYDIPAAYYALKLEGYTPVFCLGDHVLIERFTGKTYSYKAVSLKTQEIASLFYTRNPLAEKKHQATAQRMVANCDIESPPLKVVMKAGLEIQTEQAHAIFTHVLTRYGYGVRVKQIELAIQMLEVLHESRILLSEAAVGTGKTHAYIIASALYMQQNRNEFWIRSQYQLTRDFRADTPMPIVISTSSIALQKAITEDYIPEISRILLEQRLIKRPLSCVVRKGKEHYICDARLKEHMAQADAKTQMLLQPLTQASYLGLDMDGMDFISAYIKRKICVTGSCNMRCPLYDDCRYRMFLKYAQSGKHDLQVCNHNYLLADLMRRSQSQRPLIPNYQAIIIDEAHKFEQAAQSMYGNSVEQAEISLLTKQIMTLKLSDRRLTNALPKYCARLLTSNDALFAALRNPANTSADDGEDSTRMTTSITGSAKTILRNIRRYLDELRQKLSDNPGVTERQEHLYSYILWMLEKLSDNLKTFQSPDKIIYWLEKSGEKSLSLCCIPKHLGKSLFQDLWSKSYPILLTSGTLSVNGRAGGFEHIKKRIGLDYVKQDRLVETSKPSPFDHRNNCLLYISEQTPFPDNKSHEYIEAIAKEIERLIQATHGHTAILFTSYRAMELVYKILQERELGFPLLKLGKGGTRALERFKKSGNGVIFASGSLWEGIDLPGDVLSSLIIVRLPFAVPDAVSEFEQQQYESMEEYKRAIVIPDMLLKLKQGFGRLIRLESDTGVVSILDSRARLGGTYRQKVLAALPLCRVTSRIEDVANFIETVKDEDYFQKEKRLP